MQWPGEGRRRSCRIVAVLVMAGGPVACTGASSSCPPGLVRQGGTCVPVPDTTPHEAVLFPDDGPGDEVVSEAPSEVVLETPEATPEETAGNPDAAPGGFVGLPCTKDGDCRTVGTAGGGGWTGPPENVVCLDWPGGYCTALDCGGAGGACPEGTVCLGITPNKPACAQVCAGAADCRGGGDYGCKALADPEGALVRVCYQVKKAGATGEGCSGHQDCAADASCLTSFAGGYCAVLGCGADRPCPDGTACALVNGTAACLKGCSGDPDCAVPGDLPRTCASLKSALVPGEKVKVCASGTLGVPIGGQCLSDMECASEDCEVVVTGTCSGSGQGCRVDGDCPNFGEVCIQSAADTHGYCTKTCGMSVPCPGQSFCVGTTVGATGQAEGSCLPGCLEPGDKACRQEVGLSCVYGDPVNAPGHYTCARIPREGPGAPCVAPSDCESGMCLVAAGGGGYCASPCGYLGFCPFPTSCQEAGGQSRCLLRCQSTQDCPPGHECARPVGALLDVCYPM